MNLSSYTAGLIAFLLGILSVIPLIVCGVIALSTRTPHSIQDNSNSSFISGSIDYGSRE